MKDQLKIYGLGMFITLLLMFGVSTCVGQVSNVVPPLKDFTVQYDEYSDCAGVSEATYQRILISCYINRLYVITKHPWIPSEMSAFHELRAELRDFRNKIELPDDKIAKIENKVVYSTWIDYSLTQKKQIQSIQYFKGLRRTFK